MNIRDNSKYREGNKTVPVIISRSETTYAPDNAVWARPVKPDLSTSSYAKAYMKEVLLLYKRTLGNSTFLSDGEDLGYPIETSYSVQESYMVSLFTEETIKKVLPSRGWALIGVYDDGLPMWGSAGIEPEPESEPEPDTEINNETENGESTETHNTL